MAEFHASTSAAMTCPATDSIEIHFHADQTITIAGVTMPPQQASSILEEAARRTPQPMLNFHPQAGAGYEAIGIIIYQAMRAGYTSDRINARPPSAPTLRPATQADLPFLLALRHQTMDAPLIASGGTPSDEAHMQRILFCFEAARIVMIEDKPVGLLKVVRTAPVWDLIQIQVAPDMQGRGLGARLLRGVIDEATAAGAGVKLSVFKVNPARRLYERMGFKPVAETDDAIEMVYNAA